MSVWWPGQSGAGGIRVDARVDQIRSDGQKLNGYNVLYMRNRSWILLQNPNERDNIIILSHHLRKHRPPAIHCAARVNKKLTLINVCRQRGRDKVFICFLQILKSLDYGGGRGRPVEDSARNP